MSREDERKLETMLVAFETGHPDAGRNFRALLGDTPALRANLLSAIAKGNLDSIGPQSATAPAGSLGAYSSARNAIELPTALLARADRDPVLANTMRMVLTHESEHAVNKQAIQAADRGFATALDAVARGPSPHDYTTALKTKLDADRIREGTDQIGGFNAVAAHVRAQNPTATAQQLNARLYAASPEMESYFDVGGAPPARTYTPKAGLTLDTNGQLAKTPANIEAMATHFYDARPYPRYYGEHALRMAVTVELTQQRADAATPGYTAPEVRINLNALRLDTYGFAFPAGITDTSPARTAPTPTPPAPTAPTPTAPTPTAPTPAAPTPTAPTGSSSSPSPGTAAPVFSATPVDAYGGGTPFLSPEAVARAQATLQRMPVAPLTGAPLEPQGGIVVPMPRDTAPHLCAPPATAADPYGGGIPLLSPEAQARAQAQLQSPLHRQASAALDQLGGIAEPAQRENAAAAVAAKARQDGLERIDSILGSKDGKGLIALQGDPSTDYARTSYLDRTQALAQPVEQSLRSLREAPQPAAAAPEPAAPQPGQGR